MFETAVVNETSVFKPLKVYCIHTCIFNCFVSADYVVVSFLSHSGMNKLTIFSCYEKLTVLLGR